MLHHLGTAAVGRIRPHGTNTPFYCVRFRHHYAETFDFLSDAFATVRAMREAELAHSAQEFTLDEVAAQLLLTPALALEWAEKHQLPTDQPLRRDVLRRAITARNDPKKAHYLNLLSQLTPTPKP